MLLVLFLLVLNEVWFAFKPKESAVVTLKPGIVQGDKIKGEVSRRDKYIEVKPDQGPPEIYPWDQVVSITETNEILSQRIDRIIDWFDLISKLGILAAAGVFWIGLYQYDQGQQWKREEFLASTMHDFNDSLKIQNARQMLDSLKLYQKGGRPIKLYPDQKEFNDQYINVSGQTIRSALSTDDSKSFNLDEIAIRDCFDVFLSFLERFDHYIESGLVTKEAVFTYINYWIEMLGTGNMMEKNDRDMLFKYVVAYKFNKVLCLLEKYGYNIKCRSEPNAQKESK
ncbi:MAG TPA: hypothetical protein VLJ61_03145 [Pyrinomonadaceae bacterium]|nr:hypothetical protein [Pyrinomonadaceae bacterium]